MTGTWHVLDVRAIWIREMAAALAAGGPVIGWLPEIGGLARLRDYERPDADFDPRLDVRRFPLQRGFARGALARLAGEGKRLAARLEEAAAPAAGSVAVFTSPHYAAAAEAWRGPSAYYVTDYFPAYGEDPDRVLALDRRMVRAAAVVAPNSRRIADYLVREAGAEADRVVVVPNATRAANLLPSPLLAPLPLPADAADLPRPVVGVIGNLAANTDWCLLREVMDAVPALSWLLVGPCEMEADGPDQEAARSGLRARGGRVRFLGPRPYGDLASYARGLDVAVMPYRRREPTFSGSSTRFYEHLAACRPMLATDGFAELLEKPPLVEILPRAAEMAARLRELASRGFRDGQEEARWRASREGTWEARAAALRAALAGGRRP